MFTSYMNLILIHLIKRKVIFGINQQSSHHNQYKIRQINKNKMQNLHNLE